MVKVDSTKRDNLLLKALSEQTEFQPTQLSHSPVKTLVYIEPTHQLTNSTIAFTITVIINCICSLVSFSKYSFNRG